MSGPALKQPPTKAELYRAVALATSGLTLLLLWRQHPFVPLAWVCGAALIPLCGLMWRWTWAPAGLVAIYLLADRHGVFASPRTFGSGSSWIEPALLAYVAAHFRFIAATESVARERFTLWQLARQPLRVAEVFRRNRDSHPSPPADMHELFRFIAWAPINVAVAIWVLNLAPYSMVENWQVAPRPQHAALLAIFLTLAIPALLIRSILRTVDRVRTDPLVAELELNETVWKELRPELTSIGRAVGRASEQDVRRGEG